MMQSVEDTCVHREVPATRLELLVPPLASAPPTSNLPTWPSVARPFLRTAIIIVFAACSNAAVADEYTVTIDKTNVRLVHVEASLIPNGNIIWMNDEGNQGLKNGWATFVERLEISRADGQTIPATPEPFSRWRLATSVNEPIRVTYDVRLEHDRANISFGDNGAAYANDTGVMWAGQALFIVGRDTSDVTVSFRLPRLWKVTSPWTTSSTTPNVHRALNTGDLVNSAFFAGTHRAFALTSNSAKVRFAFAGQRIMAMKESVEGMVKRYLEYYTNTFGPASSANLFIVASDSSYWGGEVMGRTVSLSIGTGNFAGHSPLLVLSHILAHELFHLWGERELVGGDLDWFVEGFTAEYLSYLAGLRTGDINEAIFLQQLGDHWKKYRRKHDGKTSLMAAGADKSGNYDLIYSGGLIAAAALDLNVRHKTRNQKTLEDLIRRVLADQRRTKGRQLDANPQTLSVESVLSAASNVYGEEFGALLRRYVESPIEIPFEDALKLAGLAPGNASGAGPVIVKVEDPTDAQSRVWQALIKRQD